MVGHVVIAGSQATAWFTLPPVAWSFRPADQRYAAIMQQTAQIAQLAGRRCRIRVTHRPFPVSRWAQALDADVRGHGGPMPGPCPQHPYRSESGCRTCKPGFAWVDWLMDQQVRVGHWGTDDKLAYLGVDLSPRMPWTQALSRRRRPDAGLGDGERARIVAEAERVTRIVSGGGLAATPAGREDLQWLFDRSCGLLLDPRKYAPARAAAAAQGSVPGELAPLIVDVPSMTCEPMGKTVAVTAPDGTVRHVAVVAISDLANQVTPPDSPWLQRTDLLPFPVELMVTFDVLDPAMVKRVMRRKIKQIREQVAHISVEHGQQPPLALERQHAEARVVEDEADHASPVRAARVHMWPRIAVAGDTPEEAIQRAAHVAEMYSPHVTAVHPVGQYRLVREFCPGEPLATAAYAVPMTPARLAMAGMPAVTTSVGHRDGFPLGTTSRLAGRAVMFNPWHAMERSNASGLVTVTGALGSGKTTLIGILAYMAVRAGVATVIMDPSALLDQFCRLPELAPHSVAVNLLTSPAGTLNPYALIADPGRAEFDFDDNGRRRDPGVAEELWRRACQSATVTRRQLAKDVIRMLLPADSWDKDRRDALELAAQQAPADATSSPWQVIEILRGLHEHGLARDAHMAAIGLEELAEHAWARLFFAPDGASPEPGASDLLASSRLLTVLTLKGLVLPSENRAPSEWTVEERLSVPILHMAAYLTRRHVLARDRHQRKAVFLDEAHALTADQAGRAFLNLLGRDSRKHDLVGVCSSQLPGDLTAAGMSGLVGATFTGRTEGLEQQSAALTLAGLPAGHGYEALLGQLSGAALHDPAAAKEFLVTDAEGGREIVAIDLGGSDTLRRALNSTPAGRLVTAGQAPPAAVPAGRHGTGAL